MKAIPVKAIRRLLEEVGEMLADHPDADVTYIQRFGYDLDRDSEIVLRAESPVHGVEIGASTALHWESLRVGEGVIRLHRPARAVEPESDSP